MFYQQKKTQNKYAVTIPVDGDMLYVTEGDSEFHVRAKLFDTIQQATSHAELWGEQATVVEYIDESDIL